MKSRCLDTRLRLLTQMMVLCPAVVAECPEMSDHLVTEVKCHFRISQRRHLCYATVRLFETFCDHSRTDQHHLDHKKGGSCQGIKNCRHKFIWKMSIQCVLLADYQWWRFHSPHSRTSLEIEKWKVILKSLKYDPHHIGALLHRQFFI